MRALRVSSFGDTPISSDDPTLRSTRTALALTVGRTIRAFESVHTISLGELSEREAERKVNRAPGIVASGIEIVAVFEAGRAHESFPTKTAAHRVKRFV